MIQQVPKRSAKAQLVAFATSLAALLAALPAQASFMQGETLEKAANVIAIVVICLVPIIGIVVFWLVHILPEKIAHKNHHPQTKAIQVLCLLSLVFGGLLWPLAWLWAYTKPTSYRQAYGTDKGDEYFVEMGERLRAGTLSEAEIAHLRDELDAIRGRGAMTPEMSELRRAVEANATKKAAATPAGGAA